MGKILSKYMEMLGINEMPSVLEKYLSVPSLVRLKKVGYFCGMDYASKNVYDFSELVSRYDHSLTVALMTWKLTKDLKATLAGLFHDISTPCFSHVIDYMNKDYEKQESTEEKTEEVIMNDIYLLDCLKEDNINVLDIVDFKKYSVVDLDRPMMCADRLDGIILTGLFWTKNITIDDVYNIVNDIYLDKNEDGLLEISFKNEDVAKLCKDTNDLIATFCQSKEDNYMMELLALITKRALLLGVLSYDDLFVLTEEEIMKLLNKCDDFEIKFNLYLFKNIDSNDIPGIKLPFVKKRSLNPMVCKKRINQMNKCIIDNKLDKLKKSKFRDSFKLKENDKEYVVKNGISKIVDHTYDIIKKRLSLKEIINDGKQTPMRGHPVFIAQHATGTCCRNCLYKWHGIEKGKDLSNNEINYIVEVIITWIIREMKN